MTPDFSKYHDRLAPAIVQDAHTQKVLMLGYMNDEAFVQTILNGKVTFYSRTRQRLWTKGESSGNYLLLEEILLDCDEDAILVKAKPTGPVCHTGSDTCFDEKNPDFTIEELEGVITDRKEEPSGSSYTSSLFENGINKIAQKVGEEAVELVIESRDNSDDEKFLNEAADLLFHYLVLLQAKNFKLNDVVEVLGKRRRED